MTLVLTHGSQGFEFNEADQRCAFDMIDYWIDSRAQGRSNIPPEKIPWYCSSLVLFGVGEKKSSSCSSLFLLFTDITLLGGREALRTLLAQTVYGGRVDNEFDQRLLNSFVASFFTARSFDADFRLVDSEGVVLTAPEGDPPLIIFSSKTIRSLLGNFRVGEIYPRFFFDFAAGRTREDFQRWVDALPDEQTPAWLGLPSNAEVLLLTTQGRAVISKLLRMQSLEEDEASAEETDQKVHRSLLFSLFFVLLFGNQYG